MFIIIFTYLQVSDISDDTEDPNIVSKRTQRHDLSSFSDLARDPGDTENIDSSLSNIRRDTQTVSSTIHHNDRPLSKSESNMLRTLIEKHFQNTFPSNELDGIIAERPPPPLKIIRKFPPFRVTSSSEIDSPGLDFEDLSSPTLPHPKNSASDSSVSSPNFLQSSTPESRTVFQDDTPFGDMMEISRGDFLQRGKCSNDSKEVLVRKRERFKLSSLTDEDRAKWGVLMEAVRLDYVQKGPDAPAPEGEWKGKKRGADDRGLMDIVQRRHSHVFGHDAPALTPREIEAV
jgi:hypothetical protein